MDDKKIDQIVNAIQEGLQGHIAMDSVVHYVTEDINKRFDTSFEGYSDLLDFCEEHYGDIEECQQCGWFCEYQDNSEDQKYMGCSDCVADYNSVQETEEDQHE